jgi:hypothetical protein
MKLNLDAIFGNDEQTGAIGAIISDKLVIFFPQKSLGRSLVQSSYQVSLSW